MLREAIFLATCNATMTNKKPFKLQKGCYTQATCLATLRKVEGRSTFLGTRNATIAVAKWRATREFFVATCNATFVALHIARKIASCNMALNPTFFFFFYGFIGNDPLSPKVTYHLFSPMLISETHTGGQKIILKSFFL